MIAHCFNNTFEMSKFRMMNLLDLEKLEMNMRKQEMMRNEAKDISRETGIPAHVINNEMRSEETKAKVINFDLHDGDIFNDAYEDAKDEAMEIEKEEEEKRAEKVRKVKSKISSSLSSSMPITVGQRIAKSKQTKDAEMTEPDKEDTTMNDPEYERTRQAIFDAVRSRVRESIRRNSPYMQDVKRELTSLNSMTNDTKPREMKPMIVNAEGEQQKRGKSQEPASSPPRKRLNKKQQLLLALEQEEAEQEQQRTRATVIKKTKQQESEKPNHKAPSKMNLQNLTDILQHAYNNDKLTRDNIRQFEKAKDNLMGNKSDKKIKAATLKIYRDIYKQDIYKK